MGIRLAHGGDAEPIALLSRRHVEAGLPRWSWRPERVAAAIASADHTVWVVRDGEEIIAAAIAQFLARRAHLALLVVRPSHRRRGVARRLLARVEQTALTAGIRAVRLEVRATNRAARAFYETQSYRELARLQRYYARREPALVLSRLLGQEIAEAARNGAANAIDDLDW